MVSWRSRVEFEEEENSLVDPNVEGTTRGAPQRKKRPCLLIKSYSLKNVRDSKEF